MAQFLKSIVFYPISSCDHCSCGNSFALRYPKVELLHKVYIFPIYRLSSSGFGLWRHESYVLGKPSVVGDNAERGFIFHEPDEGRMILEECGGVERDSEISGVTECRNEDSFSATTVEDSVRVNGIHFLEEVDEEVLSLRILELSRTNKIRSALVLYKSMELSGLYPSKHACNSLLSCLLRRGLLGDALRIFKSMESRGATTGHSYSLILKAVADAEGCDSSLKLFVEFERGNSHEKVFDAVVYNTMISVCGKADNWMQCEKLWQSMKKNGHQGTEITYSLLVSIFVRCSQNELALQAYHEMVRDGLRPENDVSQAVIKACTKEGKWELALDVFETMLDNSSQCPNRITCNVLINALGKAGEVDKAFKVYNMMRRIGHEPDGYTLNALVGALYRADRPSDALRLFDSVSRERGFRPNLHVYNTALMSCCKLKSCDRAIQILWQMEASGLSIPAASYNLVIATCEVARKPKVALQVYQRMIDKEYIPDIFTKQSIIRSCIWGSLWDEVDEILKGAPDAVLYNTAIQGMCLVGKTDWANTLYRKMRDKGFKPDGKTRALMLQKLTRS